MRELVSENRQGIISGFRDLDAEIRVIEAEIKKDDEESINLTRSTRLAVLQELGLREDEPTKEFYELLRKRRSVIEVRSKKTKLIEQRYELKNKQIKLATAFANTLPQINAPDLKPNHIYRGALARNLLLKPELSSTENRFYIQNMAYGLNPGTLSNTVDFTGRHNQHRALTFAKDGFSMDDRSREDGVVIEVPFEIVEQKLDIPPDCDKYFLLPDFLKDVRTKIYRP
ncbi:MAG: hypothetical protein AAB373_03130 [Patescibacteria group bacterium]